MGWFDLTLLCIVISFLFNPNRSGWFPVCSFFWVSIYCFLVLWALTGPYLWFCFYFLTLVHFPHIMLMVLLQLTSGFPEEVASHCSLQLPEEPRDFHLNPLRCYCTDCLGTGVLERTVRWRDDLNILFSMEKIQELWAKDATQGQLDQ